MDKLMKPCHVVPYAKPDLDGQNGLTCRDLASALNTTPFSIRRKLRRGDFLQNANTVNFKVKPCVFINKITGLDENGFVFNVNAAKAFIAKWDNEQGWGYLSFLIDCEKAVLETVPKILQELNGAKEIIKKLTRPKHGRLPNGNPCVTLTQIEVRKDMFGTEYYEPLRIKVPLSDLDEAQRAEYNLRHISKIQKGTVESIRKGIGQGCIRHAKQHQKVEGGR